MTARIIAYSKYDARWNWVVEDPDRSKNRIFIDNVAFDTNTLRARPLEQWVVQDSTNTGRSSIPNWNALIPITTNGKFQSVHSTSATTDNVAYPGHYDSFICSLDYENYPGLQNIKGSNDVASAYMWQDYGAAGTRGTLWKGSDFNAGSHYYAVQSPPIVVNFWEDPELPGEFYALQLNAQGSSGGSFVGKNKPLVATALTFTTSMAGSTNSFFFIGINNDKTATFCSINGNTQDIIFYNCNKEGNVDIFKTFLHPGWPINHYQWPSNIRHVSNTRKVFYQGGWDRHPLDELKQAFFTRFEWNPVSKTIVETPCTITYPSGKTHRDFQRCVQFVSANHSANRNVWYYKPHQFTVNGTTYLTYMFIDRSNHSNINLRAWAGGRDRQNTWVTFVVGSGTNDNQLTYHSTFTFQTMRQFPRFHMPIDQIGNRLLVGLTDRVYTLTFDVDNGWFDHDSENIAVRSVAVDSTGRILLSSSSTSNTVYETTYTYGQSQGSATIWEYIPSTPLYIDCKLENNNLIYSGTNINTNIILSVKNPVANTKVVKSIRLTIDGSNAVFADGTISKIVQTSSSATISVPITITGAGSPTIAASYA